MDLRTQLGLCAAFSCLAGCHYDLDKIYQHTVPDAGDDAGAPLPKDLIELWRGQPFSTVDTRCESCAKRNCAKENTACRADSNCAEFTRCVAQSTDPFTQSDCRANFVSWLSEDIDGRDVGGPYQQCVFQDKCFEECGSRTNFQCVGEFSWPTTNEKTVPFKLRFVEARTQDVVADMTVKVCRPDDLYCTNPTSSKKTDANGEVQLALATSLRTFQGYLELSKTDLYPTLLRFGWPITEAGTTNVTVISQQSVELSISIAKVAPDPQRGLLQLRSFGCGGVSAQGVSVTTTGTDDESRYWYADDEGIPSFTATATARLGASGVINVIEGRQTITAKDSQGKVVAETAAPVRKGHMTIVVMTPLASGD